MRTHVAAFFICFYICQVAPAQASSGINLTIDGPQIVQSGQPIEISIFLSNVNSNTITVGVPISSHAAEEVYQIDVKGPAGVAARETEYMLASEGRADPISNAEAATHSFKSASISKGETNTLYSVVSRLYDMKSPGKYEIQAIKYYPDADGVEIKSNKIIVLVKN